MGRVALPSLAHRGAILEHTVPMFFLSAFLARFERYRASQRSRWKWSGSGQRRWQASVKPVEFRVLWVAVVGVGQAGIQRDGPTF